MCAIFKIDEYGGKTGRPHTKSCKHNYQSNQSFFKKRVIKEECSLDLDVL